jgi:hypothetical protein
VSVDRPRRLIRAEFGCQFLSKPVDTQALLSPIVLISERLLNEFEGACCLMLLEDNDSVRKVLYRRRTAWETEIALGDSVA